MKTHSTNYFQTLIEVAPDTKALQSAAPPRKDKRTVAERHFEKLQARPYRYTSDDLLFETQADIHEWDSDSLQAKRQEFFSKGQACLRASSLTKIYGFGIHANETGHIALIPMESSHYQALLEDDRIHKVKAMRSTKPGK